MFWGSWPSNSWLSKCSIPGDKLYDLALRPNSERFPLLFPPTHSHFMSPVRLKRSYQILKKQKQTAGFRISYHLSTCQCIVRDTLSHLYSILLVLTASNKIIFLWNSYCSFNLITFYFAEIIEILENIRHFTSSPSILLSSFEVSGLNCASGVQQGLWFSLAQTFPHHRGNLTIYDNRYHTKDAETKYGGEGNYVLE